MMEIYRIYPKENEIISIKFASYFVIKSHKKMKSSEEDQIINLINKYIYLLSKNILDQILIKI